MDTVGSLGIPGGLGRLLTRRRYEFHDTNLSGFVDFAVHACAIDEHRPNFKPTMWSSVPIPIPGFPQVIEQRWFVGCHTDVGGRLPGRPAASRPRPGVDRRGRRRGRAGAAPAGRAPARRRLGRGARRLLQALPERHLPVPALEATHPAPGAPHAERDPVAVGRDAPRRSSATRRTNPSLVRPGSADSGATSSPRSLTDRRASSRGRPGQETRRIASVAPVRSRSSRSCAAAVAGEPITNRPARSSSKPPRRSSPPGIASSWPQSR